jgi:hypothetical protein
MVRCDTSAQELGLIKPEMLTGDALLNAASADPAVRPFFIREDRYLPDTVYELARARFECQERMGIPLEQRVVLSSGEVEDLLMPLIFDMKNDLTVMNRYNGHRVPVLECLREKFRHYRELSDFVVISALRDFRHDHPEIGRLRAAAKAMAVEPAAA